MPDGSPRPSQASSLPEIKISQLPVGSAANLTDLLEASQQSGSSYVSASISVGQVATAVAGTLPAPPTIPTTLPPSGAAAGDLAGTYPNPTIKPSVALSGSPTSTTPATADNSTRIATTAFVQTALGGVSVTVPAGTVAYGGTGGVLSGDSGLAWNSTGKNLAITGYTGAAAAFSATGSVPASPAVDAFLMSISNPSGNTGNIFRLRAGASGTTDQFKVDMTGDGAFSGSVQALALSAPPAGGNAAFGLFLGNFSGGNTGLFFGTGAPTFSTFGRFGSLYMNQATPGIPYYNNNGTTGWDQLVGLTATQTLTNKSATTPAPGDNTTKIATTAYVQAALAAGASGAVMQTVTFETGAAATGTTLIPGDDTIPQITEGDQYMSLAITPRSATSRLIIEVTAHLTTSSAAGGTMAAALFQDSTANALACGFVTAPLIATGTLISFKHIMTSGTTSATTFRVRGGFAAAGTTTFNGYGGGRLFGGTLASSIVITEVLP